MSGEIFPNCKVVDLTEVKPGWVWCGFDYANKGTDQEVCYTIWRPPIGIPSDEEMVRTIDEKEDSVPAAAKSIDMDSASLKNPKIK